VGKVLAQDIVGTEAMQDIGKRAKLLHGAFNVKGTTLMKFIYDTFPEVVSLRKNEGIPP
jgi:hypothetical protein